MHQKEIVLKTKKLLKEISLQKNFTEKCGCKKKLLMKFVTTKLNKNNNKISIKSTKKIIIKKIFFQKFIEKKKMIKIIYRKIVHKKNIE